MRSSFPEAEVTRSLSSNLLKRGFTKLSEDDTRVINTNDLVAKRIQELSAKMQQTKTEGFVSGLAADKVDALVADTEEPEVEPQNCGNVIKAGEDLHKLREDAEAQAAQIVEEAKTQAESILQDARAQAESEKQAVLEQARKQGLAEAQEQADRIQTQREAEYREKTAGLDAEYQKMIDELEPKFVDTITGIYEHIFHVDLHSYREVLCYLISTTMRNTEDNKSFLIHVSKEDYPYVSMQKKQITAQAVSPNASVEIIEDMTLGKGECLIETEGGIFDCGLGTQLAELRQKLKLLSYEG